jgi:hypothetical protein
VSVDVISRKEGKMLSKIISPTSSNRYRILAVSSAMDKNNKNNNNKKKPQKEQKSETKCKAFKLLSYRFFHISLTVSDQCSNRRTSRSFKAYSSDKTQSTEDIQLIKRK